MESLNILAMLLVVAACILTITFLIIRLLVRKRLTRGSWVVAGLALLPIIGVLASAVIATGVEYNPTDVTMTRIAGVYSNADSYLELRLDGTYSSKNVEGLDSGTWSHFDCNLTFDGSSLNQPRWIIRRGQPAILPYYSGADGSDGLILTKKPNKA
jgi:hypothetical protein